MFGALCIKKRYYQYTIAFLSLLILWQVFSIVDVTQKKNEMCLVVYQVNKATAFDLKNKTQLRFSSTLDQRNYNFHIRNHHTTYNYTDAISFNYNYLKSGNFSFLQVRTSQELALINYLKPRIVLFSRNVEITPEFQWTYKPAKIIADGSNKFYLIKSIKAIANAHEMPFYSTKENGFIKLHL